MQPQSILCNNAMQWANGETYGPEVDDILLD